MIFKAFPFFVFVLLLAMVSPAHALPRDLLATASDQTLVLARVEPADKADADAPMEQTVILSRRLEKDTRWRKLATLGKRVVSVAACDEDAQVLFDSGDWMTIWADGQAFGPPAPNVLLLALAGDHQMLWAIGVPAPSTQPAAATQAVEGTAINTTAPSTQPAEWPRAPAIYRFDGVKWSRIMALPEGMDSKEPAALSLAIVDHQPVLATSSGGHGIRVWTGQDQHWSEPHDLGPAQPILNFDILNAGLPPTIWLSSGGAGLLTNIGSDRPLAPDGAAATDSRSAARAAEAIRLFSASGDHLYEQAYSADGRVIGKRAELVIDLMGPDSDVQNWLAPTLTIVVTMLLFGAARRGGVGEMPAGLAESNLMLAPLLPRFAAGTIDALPVLLSILYVARQMALSGIAQDAPTNQQMIPFYIASGIYLFYTIGSEILFGKTLGKWIFGLQIVSLDGSRPPRAALLLRNVLRIVDLILMWLPLAMILFSPLRQRVGDLAARTLVVRKGDVEPPKPEA